MKKLMNTAFIYAIIALASGVFYREFTRISNYTGKTSLAVAHVHLLALGSLMFLILVLFEKEFKITKNKFFGKFYIIYNAGLVFMTGMFIWRGVDQVLGLNGGAMISGIAGLSHIIFTVGIIMMFIVLRNEVIKAEEVK
ncbi:MAG: DUF2871 domain-containing protein [Clostridium baratii]|uniref:DUF2871 domain-containing protein n=1 Tax=Clostridium baratii TaxID=1561 RepID=UPI0006C20C72|nr:DUF2871 domain-containing protein [Clostridium baratii]MBS6007643.1 DUF2871 domain-containing protein [Clostridium baratii]MDU1054435.1 DUF2871 domain-containing protein [Clostridium baratii]MDU4911587.1 DUF2871 domain-containing protein [Clostridium baratii]CUP60401.1 Protein of uncharacterised function (DUF2871) [Clostridium baratii]